MKNILGYKFAYVTLKNEFNSILIAHNLHLLFTVEVRIIINLSYSILHFKGLDPSHPLRTTEGCRHVRVPIEHPSTNWGPHSAGGHWWVLVITAHWGPHSAGGHWWVSLIIAHWGSHSAGGHWWISVSTQLLSSTPQELVRIGFLYTLQRTVKCFEILYIKLIQSLITCRGWRDHT